MAKKEDESILLGIRLDNDQLKVDAAQAQKIIEEISNAAISSGAKIKEAWFAASAALNKDNDDKAVKAEEERLEKVLANYLTYQGKVTQIAKKYAKERADVIAAGGTDENIALVDEAERKAMEALDLEYAQKESTFRKWMEEIAKMGLEELEKQLLLAEQALANAKDFPDAQLAVYRAKVAQARKEVQEANEEAQKSTDAEKQYKEWQKLYTSLQKVGKEFDNIGTAVGGVAGQAIKTAGTIGTSTMQIVEGILSFSEISARAIEGVSASAANAIRSVEQASVILAIIGAIIKIVTSVAGIIKGNREAAEAATQKNHEYAMSLREIDNESQKVLHETIFGDNIWKKFNTDLDIANEALKKMNELFEDINTASNDLSSKDYDSDIFINTAKKCAIYDKPVDFHIEDYLNEAGKMDRKSLDSLKKFYETHKGDIVHAEDRRKLENYIQQAEFYVEANEALLETLTALWGDLASNIADNMIDAFIATGDAAKNLGDIVTDVGKKMAKSLIESLLLDDDTGIFNKTVQEEIITMFTSGEKEEATKRIQELVQSAESLAPDVMELLTAFGITADATANAAGAAREASAKGITTASQGSIDDLNGRFSAIQGHTFSIAESTKTLLINSSQQLARLAAIEFNTNELHAIRENMGVMREDMKHMRRGIDDMSLKGITLK